MTTTSQFGSSPHDELPQPYRLAVQTILDEPSPQVDHTRLVPTRVTRAVASSSRRRFMTRLCGVSLAGAAAVLLVVSFFALRPVDAWAQVVQAVRKQPWVRLHATAPDKSAQVEIWMSPTKRIGAASFPGGALFVELDQHTRRRFDQKMNTIYVAEPEPGDLDEFVSLDAALEAFANKQEQKQSQAEGVKLVAQANKKGVEGDVRWTDYILDYEDSGRLPPRFRRVFRVPEGAELPTMMTEEFSIDGKTTSRSYTMEYPGEGLADLYALNVPKDAKVVDTRSGEELRTLLSAYAKAQGAETEPYSATVLVTFEQFKYLTEAYHVHCDGKLISVEVVDGEQLSNLNDQIASGAVKRPEGADLAKWWEDEVAKLGFRALESKSGKYFPHQVTYPLLGLPDDQVQATLNPKPFVGPGDCQLLTIDDAKTGNRRFWLDPARGSMVTRWEHQPAEGKPGDWIETTIVDAAEKSPKGRWYPTLVRHGQVERSGEDLRPVAGVAPIPTQVFRYVIKFE